MQILVITPVKYPAPFLQEAITSVYQNKGAFFVKHLIVYQGVKKKHSQRTICQNYVLEYLHSDGEGVSQNRNKGLAQYLNFDIIAFLDADDIWAPDIISSAINQLTNGIDVVSFYGVPLTSRKIYFKYTTPFVGDQILNEKQKVLNYIGCPSGVFFRSHALSIK
ncbi:glycosyltransferase family 2 protein, partial [Planktomarina temperata]|nr:glycosyltransferase family 2 protein [Planktomarina temperata]